MRPLFITGGSGITPIMSMLRTYDIIGNVPDIVHVHYAPHAYDAIFRQECEDLADRHDGLYTYRPVHTRELGTTRSPTTATSPPSSSRSCAPTGGTARSGPAGRRACWTPSRSTSATPGCPASVHVERFRAAMADVERRRGWRRDVPARRGRDRHRGARASAAAAGRRGRRPEPAARLPHGHLPHLRQPAAVRERPGPAQRARSSRRARPDDPDLHHAPPLATAPSNWQTAMSRRPHPPHAPSPRTDEDA